MEFLIFVVQAENEQLKILLSLDYPYILLLYIRLTSSHINAQCSLVQLFTHEHQKIHKRTFHQLQNTRSKSKFLSITNYNIYFLSFRSFLVFLILRSSFFCFSVCDFSCESCVGNDFSSVRFYADENWIFLTSALLCALCMVYCGKTENSQTHGLLFLHHSVNYHHCFESYWIIQFCSFFAIVFAPVRYGIFVIQSKAFLVGIKAIFLLFKIRRLHVLVLMRLFEICLKKSSTLREYLSEFRWRTNKFGQSM